MVMGHEDVVGLDSSVILAREVWEASGHVATFSDPLTECTSCHKRYRADHLEEQYKAKHKKERESLADMNCPAYGTRNSSQHQSKFLVCSTLSLDQSKMNQVWHIFAQRPRRESLSTLIR
jgi:glycyl-tRNA synthetase